MPKSEPSRCGVLCVHKPIGQDVLFLVVENGHTVKCPKTGKNQSIWGIPKGGRYWKWLEDDPEYDWEWIETPEKCALRELREETSIQLNESDLKQNQNEKLRLDIKDKNSKEWHSYFIHEAATRYENIKPSYGYEHEIASVAWKTISELKNLRLNTTLKRLLGNLESISMKFEAE